MNSIDEIIEIYKRDVDVTLIDESLKLTVEERMEDLRRMAEFAEEVRAGMERARDKVR